MEFTQECLWMSLVFFEISEMSMDEFSFCENHSEMSMDEFSFRGNHSEMSMDEFSFHLENG